MDTTWDGMYIYKGFTIWSPSERQWIAEPNWSITAIENFKYHAVTHSTIAKAKKWVRDEGVNLKEKDYL